VPEFGPGARERKKQATRARLEAAALELFAEQGFDRTTVDEIAVKAEVSPRTFFRYFATKDDVVFGDRDEQVQALQSAVTNRPRGEPQVAMLTNALVAFSRFLEDQRESFLARRQLTDTNPSLVPRVLLIQQSWADALATALARHNGGGEPTFEQRALASAAIAVLAVALGEWRVNGTTTALPSLTQQALAAVAAQN
jgi:AcrR family transcriptional regulator